MFESKYSKVLTVILVIVIVAIVGLLGFLAFDFIQNYILSNDAADFVEDFNGEVNSDGNTAVADGNTTDDGTNPLDQIESENTGSGSTKRTYKGFGVVGTMRIPATNFSYPILEKVTRKSIETAVAFQWGAGINQVGNSVIIGHNYRNGLFFSNNKKLQIGDKIYIKDNSGTELTYTIYDKFETSDSDTSFYQRDTGGKPEVTLSTCTDDSSARLIILARAEDYNA